ncbi:MAG TPA: hypothetical protein VJL61_06755 [Rhodanobacteraceae bacterium]|nr:hypothetical protein [Rhodanobacteraceae bacterium]
MPLSAARQALAEAQAALKVAGEQHQANHDRHQALNAITRRAEPIRAQLAEVEAAHAAALEEWATNGATGDSPSAPTALAKLTNALAVAERETTAAQTAAKAFEPKLAESQAAMDTALQNMRRARGQVLYEIARPLVERYRAAQFEATALREHLFGLGMIGPSPELPDYTAITQAINASSNLRPVLEPGGAEASRQAWRDVIAALAGDPTAQLGPAPKTVDPWSHLDRQVRAQLMEVA